MIFKNIFGNFFSFLTGLLFIQIPAFIEMYVQRLGGHVSELKHQLDKLESIALTKYSSLEEYINKLIAFNDPDVFEQGRFMQDLVERHAQLAKSLEAIVGSSLWVKPFIFLKNIDFKITKEGLKAFHPTLPISFEAFCYALTGIIFSTLIFSLFLHFIKKQEKNYVSSPREAESV